jgi:hypothetical protein
MSKDEKTFVVQVDDKDKTYYIKEPALIDQQAAQRVYNTTFAQAVNSEALLRAKLDKFVREQGVWDDSKEAELSVIQKNLSDAEKKLAKGGIRLSTAKEIALDMRKWRAELRVLMADRLQYDNNTAEGQADNARFNYLVSSCTIDKDTDKAYFKSYEDFLNKNGTDMVAAMASQKLAAYMYGLDSNYENTLVENEFLKEYSFIDDELRLVNKEGHLIDTKGRLINDEGRYVDKDDNLVDVDGNIVNEDGRIQVEDKQPFLDDEDQPIINEDSEKEDEAKEEPEEVPVEQTVEA